MMNSPIVSVVVPMYNVEKYIKHSLASVLNQTLENFEVICVDDGGNDGTVDYVKSLSDPRIRLISQSNRGLAGARNTGIAAARGEYIALLDADDIWLEDKLALHVAHLNSQPDIGVSYCPSLFIDEQGERMGIGQYPKLTGITTKHIFCRNPIGNGSAPVIRKEALESIVFSTTLEPSRRQYFDETFRQSEDIECWLRMALTSYWRFEGIPQPLTLYRVNASGLSANLSKQYQSWRMAVAKNYVGNETFFARWFNLANAYQLRYLSRRAVQSRNPRSACKMMFEALISSPRMMMEEPKKTCFSILCAVLAWLPTRFYGALERSAMSVLGRCRMSL